MKSLECVILGHTISEKEKTHGSLTCRFQSITYIHIQTNVRVGRVKHAEREQQRHLSGLSRNRENAGDGRSYGRGYFYAS